MYFAKDFMPIYDVHNSIKTKLSKTQKIIDLLCLFVLLQAIEIAINSPLNTFFSFLYVIATGGGTCTDCHQCSFFSLIID